VTPDRIRKTVGIDLGTTNSVIALLDPTDSVILTGHDHLGRCTFPSVVGCRYATGELIAGRDALALADTRLFLRSVKRFMGLDRTFTLGPHVLTPAEASAHVLRLLRDVLAGTLNDPRYLLDAAIVTMPAYFNHNQIEATRQAGELAGYEVVELLHEPTAAAIYYAWACNHGDAIYLVYDLGGGTFDVSVIRKHYGDYEVLGVSGDPFLGGDDFDRLLASHLQARLLEVAGGSINFDLNTPEGSVNFLRLVHAAERFKIELSDAERVRRPLPDFTRGEGGATVSLEVEVDRTTFNRLIRDKVDRTIEYCQQALHRARERFPGLTLSAIDHVILVGGSSRIPLVRDTIRAAFCNPNLPERVRDPEPLLSEPDLCVAYGAALRAASYGTRYYFRHPEVAYVLRSPEADEAADAMELHLTSPLNTRSMQYQLVGAVRGGETGLFDGGSVRVHAQASGLVEEAFLDERGSFAQVLELAVDQPNSFQLTLCDGLGQEIATLPVVVRHTGEARPLGQAVLPTQIITKPLQIEVLNRARQRVKQVVAPVGATLPGTFRCTLRTVDQAGRIVVPVLEENRVIKQIVVADLDPGLPVGTPVEVEMHLDVKHTIQVKVVVREAGRTETVSIEAPPPPAPPTRREIDELCREIEAQLPEFSGTLRTRAKGELARVLDELNEALSYDDEPRAIQRMAELRDLHQQLLTARTQVLDPPWTRFAQLVKHCLIVAGQVADRTGRKREELFEQVYTQERYAEQSYEEKNQTLYRECWDNLVKLSTYLEQLLAGHLPGTSRGPRRPPTVDDVRHEARLLEGDVNRLRERLGGKGREDLVARVEALARAVRGLGEHARADLHASLREVQRLHTELVKIDDELAGRRARPGEDQEGMLEGTF
jgi:molecular chaperone DnaK